jgi:cyclohexadienyl dehydratase
MRYFAMLGAAAAALLAAIVPAGAGQVLDAINARGTLLVGTTGDYKPFSFRNPDGSYQGADADIVMAERLAQHLGVKVVFIQTSWGSMMDDFVARKFDMAVGGATILPARTAKGDFTPAIDVDGKRPVALRSQRERFVSRHRSTSRMCGWWSIRAPPTRRSPARISRMPGLPCMPVTRPFPMRSWTAVPMCS